MLPHNFSEKLLYAASSVYAKFKRGNIDSTREINTIVAVKWDEIGDLCYALHVFDALKATYPNSKIHLICKSFAKSLVEGHPSIDFVSSDFKNLPKKVDVWLELRGTFKSLLFSLGKNPLVFLDRGSVRLSNKRKGGHPHELITNLQIIEPLVSQLTESDFFPKLHPNLRSKEKVADWLNNQALTKYAVFHPGARKELRRWAPERFVEIGNFVFKQYGYQLVLAGDASELNLLASLSSKMPSISKVFPSEMGLDGLAALLEKASLYVGNESGPLCMAAVSSIPCIGLFGPGEPRVFYPPGKKSRYIHEVLDCNPCDQIHCKYPDNSCMNRIQVEEVKCLIDSLLNERNE